MSSQRMIKEKKLSGSKPISSEIPNMANLSLTQTNIQSSLRDEGCGERRDKGNDDNNYLLDQLIDTLNELTGGGNKIADDCIVTNPLLLGLMDKSSKLFEKINKLRKARVLCSNYDLPAVSEKVWTKRLKMCSWNIGRSISSISDVEQAVLFIIMHVIEFDIIFLQELKDLTFGKIGNTTGYKYTFLPPSAGVSDVSKRGQLIIYKEELKDYLFNPRKGVTDSCTHYKDKNNTNCEFISVDIKIRLANGNEATRRLMGFYHTTEGRKTCEKTVPEFLKDHCLALSTILMGDGNFKYAGKDYSNTVASGLTMTNIQPNTWHTYYLGSYLDVVFTNTQNKSDLIVHKPIKPFDLVNFVIEKARTNKSLKSILEGAKIQDKVKTNGSCHYILVVELGEKVNHGNQWHCCSEDDGGKKKHNGGRPRKNPEGNKNREERASTAPPPQNTSENRADRASVPPEVFMPTQRERLHCGEKCRFVQDILENKFNKSTAKVNLSEVQEEEEATGEDDHEIPGLSTRRQ